MLRFKQNKIPEFEFRKAMKKPVAIRCVQIHEPFEVETLEGTMQGKKGDWLLIGVRGEMYPCDRNIFEETYSIIE